MCGGYEIDVFGAALFQFGKEGGECRRIGAAAELAVRDLEVLAERTAQGASAEKDGPRPVFSGNARFFVRVQSVFDDAHGVFAAARARMFFSVCAAFERAERTLLRHTQIVTYFLRECKAIVENIDFSFKKIYN